MNANKQGTGKIVSYPSTAAMAHITPAGLERKVMEEIIEAINPVIADGFVLYEKTKNFYLNSENSPNNDYKALFDEQAREICLDGYARRTVAANRRHYLSQYFALGRASKR